MTTLTDTFDRANQSGLGTSSQGTWSWTVTVGAMEINGNLAFPTTLSGGEVAARAESNLASDNHYAQAILGSVTTLDGWCVVARYSASVADTYYLASVTNSTTLDLYKRVTGTFTQLGTASSLTLVAGDTIKLECSGSNITIYQNGVSRVAVSDTAITGNLRTGIRAANIDSDWDNFQAADLPVSASQLGATIFVLP